MSKRRLDTTSCCFARVAAVRYKVARADLRLNTSVGPDWQLTTETVDNLNCAELDSRFTAAIVIALGILSSLMMAIPFLLNLSRPS